MEDYKQYIIVSAIFLIFGIVLLGYGASINVPSPYETFLGIPYATNPEYATTFYNKLASLMLGFACLGMGVGLWAPIITLYRIESKIMPPRTQPTRSEKFFCRYCGRENKPDAMYCEACGKKL